MTKSGTGQNSGVVYDVEIIGGMGTICTPINIQSTLTFDKSKNVLIHLTSELGPKKHIIFFDNLCVSLELLIQVKVDGYIYH